MRIFAAIAISLCMLASDAHGQTSKAQGAIRIMRSDSQRSRQGSAENFTGSVRVDPLFQANAPARASGSLVTEARGSPARNGFLKPFGSLPNALSFSNALRKLRLGLRRMPAHSLKFGQSNVANSEHTVSC